MWRRPQASGCIEHREGSKSVPIASFSFFILCRSPSPLFNANHTQGRSSFHGELSLEKHFQTHLERCFTSLRGLPHPTKLTIKINQHNSLLKSRKVVAFQTPWDCSTVLLCFLSLFRTGLLLGHTSIKVGSHIF